MRRMPRVPHLQIHYPLAHTHRATWLILCCTLLVISRMAGGAGNHASILVYTSYMSLLTLMEVVRSFCGHSVPSFLRLANRAVLIHAVGAVPNSAVTRNVEPRSRLDQQQASQLLGVDDEVVRLLHLLKRPHKMNFVPLSSANLLNSHRNPVAGC